MVSATQSAMNVDTYGRWCRPMCSVVDDIPADGRVRALPCPFDVGPLVEAIWRHPMYGDDPKHQYLRDIVIRVADRLTLHDHWMGCGGPLGRENGLLQSSSRARRPTALKAAPQPAD